jgi:hypothetical protein
VDRALLVLPSDGALVWIDEVNSASLSKDFGPTPQRFRLEEMWPGIDCGTTVQQAYSLGFVQAGRAFLGNVAVGDTVPAGLLLDMEQVLASFRVDDPSFPPQPTGPLVEVASGTAFGAPWTLSAYRTDYGGKKVVCYRISGGGGACLGPKDPAPEIGRYFQGVSASFKEENGVRSETYVYGVVWKGVRGVTLILDDGRVLTSETLRSKEFPVAFYVIPYEGSAEVVSIEALDADGKVLDQHTPFAP